MPRAELVSAQETVMAQTSPWHSTKQTVHHDNTACKTGNNIEPENKRTGTGGKPLCQECKALDQKR